MLAASTEGILSTILASASAVTSQSAHAAGVADGVPTRPGEAADVTAKVALDFEAGKERVGRIVIGLYGT